MPFPIRLGTRSSKLALIQAELAKAALIQTEPSLAESGRIEIVSIKTSSDFIQDRSLADCGGKGLFTKEIEEALLERRIDFAVHSLKDVPTFLPANLVIAGVLPRGDVRDAFVSQKYRRLKDMPAGSLIGTASMRRTAQIRAIRPDLRIGLLRGNVDTRLRKIEAGEVDATLLAHAGLERMGLAEKSNEILSPDIFLPAAAQGIIGLEARADDPDMCALLKRSGCRQTMVQAIAERALLAALDGSCRTPVGAYLRFTGKDDIRIDGFVADLDGLNPKTGWRTGTVTDAESLGKDLGADLRAAMPAGFWAA